MTLISNICRFLIGLFYLAMGTLILYDARDIIEKAEAPLTDKTKYVPYATVWCFCSMFHSNLCLFRPLSFMVYDCTAL